MAAKWFTNHGEKAEYNPAMTTVFASPCSTTAAGLLPDGAKPGGQREGVAR